MVWELRKEEEEEEAGGRSGRRPISTRHGTPASSHLGREVPSLHPRSFSQLRQPNPAQKAGTAAGATAGPTSSTEQVWQAGKPPWRHTFSSSSHRRDPRDMLAVASTGVAVARKRPLHPL